MHKKSLSKESYSPTSPSDKHQDRMAGTKRAKKSNPIEKQESQENPMHQVKEEQPKISSKKMKKVNSSHEN